ncbi:polysaccharide biosynthesis tyrosine autokinase [Isoptericola sp. NPDC058082]|uniref:polysaccharide biosynthesis tyrosine autokinase n=1 Tax=Isoptericola sp. NPDC058082 TaxID=3346331 RepID=UPI0036EC7063
MGLADYLLVLRKRWVTIVLAVMVGLGLGIALSLAATPRYQTSSQAFVSLRDVGSANELVAGGTFTAQRVASYSALVTSPRVLQPVIEDLGLQDSVETLGARVTAEAPPDTVLITITVTDTSPESAAQTADAIASSLATVVSDLEKAPESSSSPVEISTVRQAVIPESPASPRVSLNLALGVILGAVVGVGTAVIRELFDTRIRTQAEVEELTGLSVIGSIAFDEDAVTRPLIVQESPQSPRAEAFRRLRTNLQFLEVDDDSRAFVVTSALPGEGKSTTAINLAIALADAGTRVVLVDGDLRRPSLSRYMGLEGTVGLTTALIGQVTVEDAVQRWGDLNLNVLASGQVPPNPSELLGSVQMAHVIGELKDRYDVVLIDSAPLVPVTDGAILARLTGGSILVAGVGELHRAHLQEAIASLRKAGARIMGVVMNRVDESERAGYRYRYDGVYTRSADDVVTERYDAHDRGTLPPAGTRAEQERVPSRGSDSSTWS